MAESNLGPYAYNAEQLLELVRNKYVHSGHTQDTIGTITGTFDSLILAQKRSRERDAALRFEFANRWNSMTDEEKTEQAVSAVQETAPGMVRMAIPSDVLKIFLAIKA
ncbi:hypothetical protein HCU64_19560 [Methylobacterium sp. C25]|uniref:hypothetical protein n=1 Tax=Methylobacterium sp. C25 TaxID=2721622 RepID=UPI001F21DAC5|nr:hypothetical protein [Methylobacterium sp. C25]MCE4225952.1 hypothetical protein [Methylobacterium sp. C25]